MTSHILQPLSRAIAVASLAAAAATPAWSAVDVGVGITIREPGVYGHIDLGLSANRKAWFWGDFNYDGRVDIDDYGIIDFNIIGHEGLL